MANSSSIQWCDDTVNPVMGCDGCELHNKRDPTTCYSFRLHQSRGRGNPGYAADFDKPTMFPGRTMRAARARDLRGECRPRKPWLDGLPRLIFISDMGDALSKRIAFEYLYEEIVLVATSSAGARHEWLWLSKRPQRMAQFSAWLRRRGVAWPRNLWAGTSITTQSTASRALRLLAVGDENTIRFISVEPQREALAIPVLDRLDWVIQGGESGPNAHAFDLAWARELRDACAAAHVAYFLKQLGRQPTIAGKTLRLRDAHGGDWSEWPDDLRIRQFPLSADPGSLHRYLNVVACTSTN